MKLLRSHKGARACCGLCVSVLQCLIFFRFFFPMLLLSKLTLHFLLVFEPTIKIQLIFVIRHERCRDLWWRQAVVGGSSREVRAGGCGSVEADLRSPVCLGKTHTHAIRQLVVCSLVVEMVL